MPMIVLEMDSPRKWLTIACDHIQAMHRVVGPVDPARVDYSSGVLRFSPDYLRELGVQ